MCARMENTEKKEHITLIGGQAVIEGVMMRGPYKTAIAVRQPDDEILVDVKDTSSFLKRHKLDKIPIVRGAFAFVESMVTGVKSLMFSADAAGLEEEGEEEPSRFEKFLVKVCGDKLKTYLIYFSVAVALILGVGMFILLPTALSGLVREVFSNRTFIQFPAGFAAASSAFVDNAVFSNLLEGVLRMAIFLTYLYLVSRMEEIRTVFCYHGAEHKTIFCYEAGLPLTVENVKKQSRFHPRCGTSFLLIVMVVSIILFSFITWSNVWVRMGMRLLLLPVVGGISYEFIKLAGRSKNKCIAWLTKPGLWMQRMTTNEPDEKQIEVAIASMNAVIPENSEDDKW